MAGMAVLLDRRYGKDVSLHCQASDSLCLGWQAMERHYVDTDISGTVLQRPGLQRLITDIEAGKVT